MLPTASKTSLVLSGCTHWVGKPPFEDKYADTSKRYIGTVFHTAAERLLHGTPLQEATRDAQSSLRKGWPGTLAGLQDATEVMARMLRAAHKWISGTLGVSWEMLGTEVAVYLNLETGERGVVDVRDRGYPDVPGTLYGTADIVGLNKYGLFVADWKTGGSDTARDQMMSLAAMMAPSGHGATISTLSLRDDECNEWDEYVSEHELSDHLGRVRAAIGGVGGDPVSGAKCVAMYCNYLYNCPSVAKSISVLANASIH